MFYLICKSIAEMREGPSVSSKVVSQALFGEEVGIGEKVGGWIRISTPDHYIGWVQKEALLVRQTPYPKDLEISRLSAHVYHVPDTEYGPILTLPFGVHLQALPFNDPRWIKVALVSGEEGYVQKGDVLVEKKDIVSFIKQFIGLPYTWGGRSSFGYDCSGFVQMVCKRIGLHLPRDAREQILDARLKEVSIEETKLGDLVFWGISEKKIGHVGIALGQGEFIHTSSKENLPFLRISKLSDPEWSGAGTYSYRVAKRVS